MRGIPRTFTAMLAAMLWVSLGPMPTAGAAVGLVPGTQLFFRGGGSCSLGFLATNADGDRLAVTAGHCADGVDQRVVSENGNPIGIVVHHTPDIGLDDGVPANEFHGVTLIQLSRNTYTADAYFTEFGNPSIGDFVKKYGARTEKTSGKVTDISFVPDNPRLSSMWSTMVTLPGDSGAAWVGGGDSGPKLVGLHIGSTERADGGFGYALGFPIRSLIALVKKNSPNWGPGFIPVGV